MTSQGCDLFPYKGMKLFPIVGTKLVFPYKGIKSGVNLILKIFVAFFFLYMNKFQRVEACFVLLFQFATSNNEVRDFLES